MFYGLIVAVCMLSTVSSTPLCALRKNRIQISEQNVRDALDLSLVGTVSNPLITVDDAQFVVRGEPVYETGAVSVSFFGLVAQTILNGELASSFSETVMFPNATLEIVIKLYEQLQSRVIDACFLQQIKAREARVRWTMSILKQDQGCYESEQFTTADVSQVVERLEPSSVKGLARGDTERNAIARAKLFYDYVNNDLNDATLVAKIETIIGDIRFDDFGLDDMFESACTFICN